MGTRQLRSKTLDAQKTIDEHIRGDEFKFLTFLRWILPPNMVQYVDLREQFLRSKIKNALHYEINSEKTLPNISENNSENIHFPGKLRAKHSRIKREKKKNFIQVK